MKGVIPDCLGKLVIEKFGKPKWQEILKASQLSESMMFLPTQDIDDKKVMECVANTCKILGISMAQATDVFGEYWVNTYAPKIYGVYFRRHSKAKEFIKGMEDVHRETTQNITNAHPPRFEFKDIDEHNLLITYKSKRNMIDFYIGLIKGVGIYFKAKIDIQKISERQVNLTFE